VFKIIYWVGIVLQIVIRAPFDAARRKNSKIEERVSRTEQILLGLLTLGGIFLPLVYSLTHWLDFANYSLSVWTEWAGVGVLVCALYIFARAHIDLKSNWSHSLEIYSGHQLITVGIYALIRHPMYTSGWLMGIVQVLLLQNWIAGPAYLMVFLPFYLLRVRAEEVMMLDTFGDEYRQYAAKTGSLFPKF
jgi:protein-S-isoprenylcysteine O-methyltransferase Ste14